MGSNLSNHFGVFDGYRKVLLPGGFPKHAAELIDLICKFIDEPGSKCNAGLDETKNIFWGNGYFFSFRILPALCVMLLKN